MRGPSAEFDALKDEILGIMGRGVHASISPERFNDLAVRVFRFQVDANPVYGRFVERRGADSAELGDWRQVPFLPTRAFKVTPLVAGEPQRVEAVFRTSGTTQGQGTRGSHFVRDLQLYRESLLPNFQAHLMPEGREMPVLCLLPPPDVVPESSLTFMMSEVIASLRTSSGRFFVTPDGGVDGPGLLRALRAAEDAAEPVLLAGTAFAFVQWLEMADESGWTFRLPQGSRVMETGGFKGRVRSAPRAELYGRLRGCLGIDSSWIVNEYGMTELLSQFYEPVLSEAPPGKGRSPRTDLARAASLEGRYHRGPPWVATRVLEPLTLTDSPAGEIGLLAHFDLANLGSVAAVVTEDLGRRVPGGFQLMGRVPGAEPRGCSLAMEDFLSPGGGGR